VVVIHGPVNARLWRFDGAGFWPQCFPPTFFCVRKPHWIGLILFTCRGLAWSLLRGDYLLAGMPLGSPAAGILPKTRDRFGR